MKEAEEALSALEERACSPELASDFEKANAVYAEMEAQRHRVEKSYTEWEQAEAEYASLLTEDDE